MKAITTKRLATIKNGQIRIKVTDGRHRPIITWHLPGAENTPFRHQLAVEQFCRAHEIPGQFHGCELGAGMVWIPIVCSDFSRDQSEEIARRKESRESRIASGLRRGEALRKARKW